VEYDPKPPFEGGSVASSDPRFVASLREAVADFQKKPRRNRASRRNSLASSLMSRAGATGRFLAMAT